MSDLLHELLAAARRLVRARAFSATVVATLALGTGALATMFALVDAALLRPAPFPEGERLVAITQDAPALDLVNAGLSLGEWDHYRDTPGLDGMAVFHEAPINLGGHGDPERRTLVMATPSFFHVLGVRALHGRLPGEDADVAEPVIVLGHALWVRRYGADPNIVGHTVLINEQARRVVAILEPGGEYPDAGAQLWMSFPIDPGELRFHSYRRNAIARLANGTTSQAAAAALQARTAALASALPDVDEATLREADPRVHVTPLPAHLSRDVAPALRLLLLAAALIVVVAVANVTGLVVARGEYVRREIAVRSALGAARGHVARLFASESLLLALAGTALGLLLAAWAVPVAAAFASESVPRAATARIDARALALGLAVAAALTLALIPAPLLRFLPSRRGVFDELRARTSPSSATRARKTLVAAQLALCLALVIGALLLGRSFLALRAVDPGFQPAGVFTFDVRLPFGRFTDDGAERFAATFRERLEAVPGVLRAGATTGLPLTPGVSYLRYSLEVEGRAAPLDGTASVVLTVPGYFETLGIEPVTGWTPGPGDRVDARRRVLVSATLARRLGGESAALGARIRRTDEGGDTGEWLTVAGIVADVRDRDLAAPPGDIVYVPVLDTTTDPGFGPDLVTWVVRTAGDPMALLPAIRAALRDVDAALPLANPRPLTAFVDDATAHLRFTARLIALGAAVALLLVGIGIQGVVAWSVAARTREFGIRMALGARGRDVDGLVLREAVRLTAIGLAAGILPALALARGLGAQLHAIGPLDPAAWLIGAGVVLALALPAAWIPAVRAGRIPPARALTLD